MLTASSGQQKVSTTSSWIDREIAGIGQPPSRRTVEQEEGRPSLTSRGIGMKNPRKQHPLGWPAYPETPLHPQTGKLRF